MFIRTTLRVALAVAALISPGFLAAQASDLRPNQAATVKEPYGIPVTPSIYLINFLLLYTSNPNVAAFMPAYRTPIPQPVFECLKLSPNGCPYADYEQYFNEQTSSVGNASSKTVWPNRCKQLPKWERLAPPKATQPEQINEPLGTTRASQIAQALGIDQSMILTPTEYQCLIGTPPRTPDQETIFACVNNLTNSNGNADTPLSSYGLSVTADGLVQSDCAPDAPCLAFNALLAGPLERIAAQCGFLEKFRRMVTATPFLKFAIEGSPCQAGAEPTCIVEAKELANDAKKSTAPNLAVAH